MLRVFARLFDDGADITRPETKRLFTRRVLEEMPKDAPGPYNEALMELGALVCLPGAPRCAACPLAALCQGHAAGRAAALPCKPPKKEKTRLPVTVALIESPAGLLLQRRPARGLLAGLWQPLAFEGQALDRAGLAAALADLGLGALAVAWQAPLPAARHIFTHRIWELGGWRGAAAQALPLPEGFVWARPEALAGTYPVPSAFAAYLPGAGGAQKMSKKPV